MRDPYLYDDIPILRNKLGIRNQVLLDNAEADYVVKRREEFFETREILELRPWAPEFFCASTPYGNPCVNILVSSAVLQSVHKK